MVGIKIFNVKFGSAGGLKTGSTKVNDKKVSADLLRWSGRVKRNLRRLYTWGRWLLASAADLHFSLFQQEPLERSQVI